MKIFNFFTGLVLLKAAEESFAFVRPSPLTKCSFLKNDEITSQPWRKPDLAGRKIVCSQEAKLRKGVKPLEASPLLALASSPLGSIAVLAGIVVVHECGHYLAARSFGIKVEEFSVGFGPRLAGFSALGNDFSLRAFPLGGYVRFPENYNITLAQQLEEEEYKAAEEYIKGQQLSASKQILNALTLGSVESKMWNEEKERRLREVEEIKSSPWWKKWAGISSKKAAYVPGSTELEYYDDPDLLQNRPWTERAVVLVGGIVFNLLLAFFIYFGQIGFGPGLPQPVFSEGVLVSAPPRPEAAANGLLRKGDVIVGINGSPVTLSKSPTAIETQKAVNDFVASIRATPDDGAVTLKVLRPETDKDKPIEVTVQPRRASSNSGPKSIGVLLSPNYVKTEMIKSNSPIEAAGLATKYVTTQTTQIANGLLSFLGSLVSGKGTGGNQVSGPVGLIKQGSEVVATKDLTTVLLFAAAISINLGVVNAIPLPALDGGQLVFVLVEALTGRKVDQKVQESFTSIAVLFLLLLTAGTFVGDLTSIFGR